MSSATVALPKSKLVLGLWAAQILLAAFYAMVGFMKLTQPIATLAGMMGWPGVLPVWFVRAIGTAELAGAIGLILPAATGIKPRLTELAAVCLVALQLCAMAFHISRGEVKMLPINLVLLSLAAFIAWGRRSRAAG